MKKIVLLFTALFALSLFSCSNSSGSDSGSSGGGVKTSDWLFLLYMDADDPNLNDQLYRNMREVEWSLAQIRNADGSPKEGYPSINVVALWDGISEDLKGSSQYMHPDGALYELGPDYELKWYYYTDIDSNYVGNVGTVYLVKEGDGTFNLGPTFKMGAKTTDLTSTAGAWLEKEPKMAEQTTLQGFLKWAKSRYTAKNVVVCLDDHGSGTHKETYSDSNATSKSTCVDTTSGDGKLLTCKNIKDALVYAGYTGADKPKILWNDVCFQATAEIVYNFAGCADYFSASPNESICNRFTTIFTSIKKDSTPVDVGKIIASTYHEYLSLKNESFNDFKNCLSSGSSMYTWSFFSLDEQKVGALKTAVDNFAKALHALYDSQNDPNDPEYHKLFNSVYTKYVKQDKTDLSKCMGLSYSGSKAFLNDLGYLAKQIKNDPVLSAAHDSAQALLDLLKHGDDKLIIYAWGGKRATTGTSSGSGWGDVTTNQMYLTGQKDFITGKSVAVENGFDDDIYGMTFVASQCNTNVADDAVSNYFDWTGFSEEWGRVIKTWLDAGL